MHENECNLAGDTITLNDNISGVIHCIIFILFTFMMIETKACYRHNIISGGCYRVSKNVLYPKMQNFKNFYYNKDNRIWYFDLFK